MCDIYMDYFAKYSEQIFKKERVKKVTWIVGPEPNSCPAIDRNCNGVHQWRINKIIIPRISAHIKIPKSMTNNVEAISMQMHRMIDASHRVSPLKNDLHSRIIVEILHLRRIGRDPQIPRDDVLRVVEDQRRLSGEIASVDAVDPFVIGFENRDSWLIKCQVIHACGESIAKWPQTGAVWTWQSVHRESEEQFCRRI